MVRCLECTDTLGVFGIASSDNCDEARGMSVIGVIDIDASVWRRIRKYSSWRAPHNHRDFTTYRSQLKRPIEYSARRTDTLVFSSRMV